ncbi:hypothetical protein [Yunchengibacter salinarum]|uniref:hypothetical protein n=1 Tax=Yunchengibacter salinarum TaxID=3133399 RepID=UPI0035B6568F
MSAQTLHPTTLHPMAARFLHEARQASPATACGWLAIMGIDPTGTPDPCATMARVLEQRLAHPAVAVKFERLKPHETE